MPSRTFTRSGRPPVPQGTPDELREQIVWEVREPVDVARSDLGHPVALPAPPAEPPPHRLVVVGDSISHGFKSFAIADTRHSWPALVARYAGFSGFRFPVYPGPSECPGLPLNLEAMARHFQLHAPRSVLDVSADALLFGRLREVMDAVEDYWERGEGADRVDASAAGAVNHDLACWGWDLRDTLSRTAGALRARVAAASRRDEVFGQIPSAAQDRSALIALAGAADPDTPLTLARRLGDEGADGAPGIETLVVALGANNVLGTVLDFEVRWTPEDPTDVRDVDRKWRFNAWSPSHFAAELDALLGEVRAIAARHVIFLTVPHVTIAPMVRGIANKMPGDRYFARYTRAWFSDEVFNANRHPCLSGDHLRVLDFAVDCYNDHLVQRVLEARTEPGDAARDWRVLDIAGVLDRLAYRRFLIDDEAKPEWWTPYELPDAYRELSPMPDTRFYRSDAMGRYEGGLFSLDGVHPSTIGYGIVAREVMRVMADCGVEPARPEPDFHELVGEDSLIADPPTRIASILDLVQWADDAVDLVRAIGGRSPI